MKKTVRFSHGGRVENVQIQLKEDNFLEVWKHYEKLSEKKVEVDFDWLSPGGLEMSTSGATLYDAYSSKLGKWLNLAPEGARRLYEKHPKLWVRLSITQGLRSYTKCYLGNLRLRIEAWIWEKKGEKEE